MPSRTALSGHDGLTGDNFCRSDDQRLDTLAESTGNGGQTSVRLLPRYSRRSHRARRIQLSNEDSVADSKSTSGDTDVIYCKTTGGRNSSNQLPRRSQTMTDAADNYCGLDNITKVDCIYRNRDIFYTS